MKTKLLISLLILPFTVLISQQWEQLSAEPEGGGVTDIFADAETGEIFVATGSTNWPNGEDGGLRMSTNDGNSWINLFDAYTSRFVMKGPDNNLYASVWDYPGDEALYRSADNGSTWDLLTSVSSGNNIFACAILEGSTNTIFAGTGQGVLRSMDNGVTWAYANTGLPTGAWVRSLAISPDGLTIAAGTTMGTYISGDNGDNWDKVTGAGEDEIISSLVFYEESEDSEVGIFLLLMGTESGKILAASAVTLFLVATLVTTLASFKGVTRIMTHRNPFTLVTTFLVSMWAATGGAFFYATGGLIAWQSFLTGLPPNPLISIFTSYFIVTTLTLVAYIAMYGNSKAVNSGSEIYKATFDLSVGINTQPYSETGISLFQNIPNPFKEQTRINFQLTETAETTLKIFDLAGNEVKSVVDGILNVGRHSINLTNEGLSSGMYYYVLRSNNYTQSKKLVIQ